MENITPQMREQMKLYAGYLVARFPDLDAKRNDQTEAVWPRVQTEAQRIVESHMPEPALVAHFRRKRRQKLFLTWTIALLVGLGFLLANSESVGDAFALPIGLALGSHLIILFNDPTSLVLRETQSVAASRLAAAGIKDFHGSVLDRRARERKSD